jgi:hypothetical protein
LETDGLVRLENGRLDGHLDLGGKYIRMSGVPHGLMAVVAVRGGKPVQLEIVVYGDVSWDGLERTWAIAGHFREQ